LIHPTGWNWVWDQQMMSLKEEERLAFNQRRIQHRGAEHRQVAAPLIETGIKFGRQAVREGIEGGRDSVRTAGTVWPVN
jgi:hypothetical protein